MKLGSLELGSVFLAPLAGISDSAFRIICKRFGADAVYTEMVSSEGLSRENERSVELLKFTGEEHPIGIQLFGRDPERMAASASQVESLGPDFIDINFACPARRIVNRGGGCALMRKPEAVGRIAAAVVGATGLPVTAKIRLGWDDESINAVEVVGVLESAGVKAVAVHGRTYRQGFKGVSSWEEVARVKRNSGIPIILSGDITSPERAERAFQATDCDAIMIGRGVYGRPWIFAAIKAHFKGEPFTPPGFDEIRRVVLDHVDLAIARLGEDTAVMRFRKHLLWYTKGLPGVVALRPAVSRLWTRQAVVEMLDRLSENLASSEAQDGKR
ncbi:MAG: tRNA dihydrouridine synthase DusB [bacterium]|jgi:tRNA-dihydrouridine synthase B